MNGELRGRGPPPSGHNVHPGPPPLGPPPVPGHPGRSGGLGVHSGGLGEQSPGSGRETLSPVIKTSPSGSAPDLRPLQQIPSRPPPVPTLSTSHSPPVMSPNVTVKAEESESQGRIIKRRAGIACRRCRRLRSKCVHETKQPPCQACREAGLGPEDCTFPARGEPDNDREFRHPRTRTVKKSRRDPLKVRREILDEPGKPTIRSGPTFTPTHPLTEWEILPPVPEIVEGIERFTRRYFQLGFIHKRRFPKRLADNPRSVNVFLVEAILSISARISPSLCERYGSGLAAANFFMERAAQLAYGEIYAEPTLERCQAFYLLSIAQQGSGLRNKSYINMGVAMRMAALMRLHREETYTTEFSTPEQIIRAESARRTLWMLHSQDQLHSSIYSPVSLAASDITALLPCEEDEFERGSTAWKRAAVEDTPPAIENPLLVNCPDRSLFASLMQAHQYWGIASRQAINLARSSRPWDITSKYALMIAKLRCWELALPRHHRWSRYTLLHYKILGVDLAYLGVAMIPRLCNIVLRRPYLQDIIRISGDPKHEKQYFYSCLGMELSWNIYILYEQIDGQFSGRDPDESVGAQMAAFCVYCCGIFVSYIVKHPHICPDPQILHDAPAMLARTITILRECEQIWPLAKRWLEGLERFSHSHSPESRPIPPEGSMADGRDPVPHPVSAPPPSSPKYSQTAKTSFNATPSSLEVRRPSHASSQGTQISHPPSPLPPLSVPPHPEPYPWTYRQLPPHIPMPDFSPNLYIHFNTGYTGLAPNPPLVTSILPVPNLPAPTLPAPTLPAPNLPAPSLPASLPPPTPNGLSMLMGTFDSNSVPLPPPPPPPPQPQPQHPLPSSTQGIGENLVAYFPPDDGFERELQLFCFQEGDWVPGAVFNEYS